MFEFRLDGTAGAARAGTLTLPHGTVETPAYMPVVKFPVKVEDGAVWTRDDR
jgi:tRNA-guanine family transglycosylase